MPRKKKKEEQEDTRIPEFKEELEKQYKILITRSKKCKNKEVIWNLFKKKVFDHVKKNRYTWEQAGIIFEEFNKKKEEFFNDRKS